MFIVEIRFLFGFIGKTNISGNLKVRNETVGGEGCVLGMGAQNAPFRAPPTQYFLTVTECRHLKSPQNTE